LALCANRGVLPPAAGLVESPAAAAAVLEELRHSTTEGRRSISNCRENVHCTVLDVIKH
jgi:hypothetical protein